MALPLLAPFALAFLMPALTRSLINSLSNCATAARICSSSLLAGLLSSVSSPCEVAMKECQGWKVPECR